MRTTPPPPYIHQNGQDVQILSNSDLVQSSKHNVDDLQSPNIMNLNNVDDNLDRIEPSSNSRRNTSRKSNEMMFSTKSNIMRYNRRNNPELERRRTHHCDFQGMNCIACILFSKIRHTNVAI